MAESKAHYTAIASLFTSPDPSPSPSFLFECQDHRLSETLVWHMMHGIALHGKTVLALVPEGWFETPPGQKVAMKHSPRRVSTFASAVLGTPVHDTGKEWSGSALDRIALHRMGSAKEYGRALASLHLLSSDRALPDVIVAIGIEQVCDNDREVGVVSALLQDAQNVAKLPRRHSPLFNFTGQRIERSGSGESEEGELGWVGDGMELVMVVEKRRNVRMLERIVHSKVETKFNTPTTFQLIIGPTTAHAADAAPPFPVWGRKEGEGGGGRGDGGGEVVEIEGVVVHGEVGEEEVLVQVEE